MSVCRSIHDRILAVVSITHIDSVGSPCRNKEVKGKKEWGIKNRIRNQIINAMDCVMG